MIYKSFKEISLSRLGRESKELEKECGYFQEDRLAEGAEFL